VSRYQKGKTNLDFTGARDSEHQWYQLGRMQVCTSLQTDNDASTSLLKFFTGRMPFLPPNQQCQSTEGKLRYYVPLNTKKCHFVDILPGQSLGLVLKQLKPKHKNQTKQNHSGLS